MKIYRVYGADIPADLKERISEIHANAILSSAASTLSSADGRNNTPGSIDRRRKSPQAPVGLPGKARSGVAHFHRHNKTAS
jgi:hypothetical protein